MRKYGLIAAFLVVAGLAASQAHATGYLYFATLNHHSGAITIGNPSLTMNVGDSATLYLWYSWGTPNGTTTQNKVQGLGLDILSSNPAVLQGTNMVMLNPNVNPDDELETRWNPPVGTGTLGDLVTGINAVAIGSNPVDGTTGDQMPVNFANDETSQTNHNPGTNTEWNSVLVGSITFQATAAGTTDIKLAAGQSLIVGNAVATSTGLPNLGFGWGDALLPVSVSGTQKYIAAGVVSTLADATVTVNAIPEPATLGLLALGGLALIRRR